MSGTEIKVFVIIKRHSIILNNMHALSVQRLATKRRSNMIARCVMSMMCVCMCFLSIVMCHCCPNESKQRSESSSSRPLLPAGTPSRNCYEKQRADCQSQASQMAVRWRSNSERSISKYYHNYDYCHGSSNSPHDRNHGIL